MLKLEAVILPEQCEEIEFLICNQKLMFFKMLSHKIEFRFLIGYDCDMKAIFFFNHICLTWRWNIAKIFHAMSHNPAVNFGNKDISSKYFRDN